MTEHEFWKLIGVVDVEALDMGDEERAIQPLFEHLRQLKDDELLAFEELLAQHLFAIDGEAFADHAGDAGGSDDGFLYARCYVVAKGREYFESVKSNPALMPNSIEQWCEALLYPHRQAWAERHGVSPADWPFSASVSYETASNHALWSGNAL